jgi:hypothetical protein
LGGDVIAYYFGGMPTGEEAKIRNDGAPERNDWRVLRIKGEKSSGWTGNFEGAQLALEWLQGEIDREQGT